MGQAKRNGTYEERKAKAILRRAEESRIRYGEMARREQARANGMKPRQRQITVGLLAALSCSTLI